MNLPAFNDDLNTSAMIATSDWPYGLAEARENSSSCSSAADIPATSMKLVVQATEQHGLAPAHATVWDYIAQQANSSAFAKTFKTSRAPAAARGHAAVGKPAVTLYNMCASCHEEVTRQQPGNLSSQLSSYTGMHLSRKAARSIAALCYSVLSTW